MSLYKLEMHTCSTHLNGFLNNICVLKLQTVLLLTVHPGVIYFQMTCCLFSSPKQKCNAFTFPDLMTHRCPACTWIEPLTGAEWIVGYWGPPVLGKSSLHSSAMFAGAIKSVRPSRPFIEMQTLEDSAHSYRYMHIHTVPEVWLSFTVSGKTSYAEQLMLKLSY